MSTWMGRERMMGNTSGAWHAVAANGQAQNAKLYRSTHIITDILYCSRLARCLCCPSIFSCRDHLLRSRRTVSLSSRSLYCDACPCRSHKRRQCYIGLWNGLAGLGDTLDCEDVQQERQEGERSRSPSHSSLRYAPSSARCCWIP